METEALMAYANKQLELPHAPRFLKATMPLLQRAMLEQYHEAFIEVTLTAEVAPRAKLHRGMTHNALVALLFAANTDSARGRQMIGRLMDDVKMLYFDGGHTLKFVFNSRRLADIYAGLAFRINGTCIVLDDTEKGERDGTYRAERMKRQYAVRVYGARQIGLVALIAALNKLPEVEIVDAERPRIDPTEITDNRYLLLHFSTEDCPLALRGVTKIDFQGQMITVHHHLLQQRMPCARCYVPYHTTGFCKATAAQIPKRQEKYLRKYNGNLPSYHVGQELQYKHSDADSFINFLQTMQREVAMTSASHSHDLPQEGVATLTTTDAERLEAGDTSTTIHATTPSSEYATGSAEGDTTGPGADGFHTARRKGGGVRLEGHAVATQAKNALRKQVVHNGDFEVTEKRLRHRIQIG
ncbi:hypothetical protein PR001_g11599 [Phytophthora rubi]|uniref:Uncharacterized protein n=2 Tax=Phytophthora rubi TaxID=129364 RepID=A0A6A3M9Q8_9STRA|nr:hypothetical protein PR002_g11946 [Phytophthora rubi]KAE9029051.1 hypothetical protein PR001_g11599 [Phytophthora rubi]